MNTMGDNMHGIDLEKSRCLYHIYNHVTEQIKFCDTKTGLMLAVSGIILGVLYELFNNLNVVKIYQIQKGILITSLITDISSIVIFFIIIYPRIGSDEDTIFYWGKIIKYKKEEYKKKIEAIKKEDIKMDLTNQIYYLSKICDKKMNYLRCGTLMLLISIISLGVLYFIIYL